MQSRGKFPQQQNQPWQSFPNIRDFCRKRFPYVKWSQRNIGSMHSISLRSRFWLPNVQQRWKMREVSLFSFNENKCILAWFKFVCGTLNKKWKWIDCEGEHFSRNFETIFCMLFCMSKSSLYKKTNLKLSDLMSNEFYFLFSLFSLESR